MLVRILGAIDLASAFAFLMMIFGLNVFVPFILFCAGLLFLKGLFILTGDVLSFIDFVASLTFILSIFFGLPVFLFWVFAFLLLGKGMVSFI